MSTSAFEIYQSLRSFGSWKKVYLILIQLKKILGFVKRNVISPLPATLMKWKAMCKTDLAAVSRYVRLLFKDTFLSMRQRCVAVIRAICGTSSIL
jgi:hypothetical protein